MICFPMVVTRINSRGGRGGSLVYLYTNTCSYDISPPYLHPTPSSYQVHQQTLAATEISGTPVSQVPPPVGGGAGGIIAPQGADLQGLVYPTSNHDGIVNLPALSSSSYPLPNSHQHHHDSISGQRTMMESMETLHAQVYRQLINISNF